MVITDKVWDKLEPMLPPLKGRPGQNDRLFLEGVCWLIRTGCPWRDMPPEYGHWKTTYNRFNRWTKAGIWDRLMDAIIDAHGGDVVMIDGTSVRVHYSAATVKKTVQFEIWADRAVD